MLSQIAQHIQKWRWLLPAVFLAPLMLGVSLGQEEPAAAAPDAVVEETAAEEVIEAPQIEQGLADLMAIHGEPFDFFTISNLWTLIAAALVLIMHLGFTCVETGLARAKNTNNIIFKNVFIIAMGILAYAAYGFNNMYPGDAWTIKGFLGVLFAPISTFTGSDLTYAYGGADDLVMAAPTDFIFQAMFAATAATIVSGAVAERIKLLPFMLFATLLVMFAYPVTGSWQWGGGWLKERGFHDFAGSSLVHAFGGFAALACVIVLGPRRGKYTADGKIRPILPHSTPLAAIGVFLLFFGWFGFNGGSVLSADPGTVGTVFVTTALGACGGALATMLTAWLVTKKPDVSMSLNGILAGLVGITAGADKLGYWQAVIVGAIAGVIVVFSIILLDKLKADDPVGAISVHGVCGIWGTIAVALFADMNMIGIQIIGTLSISAFAFVVSFIIFYIIKLTMGVRVDEEEEAEGLDIAEHGSPAYAFEVADKS